MDTTSGQPGGQKPVEIPLQDTALPTPPPPPPQPQPQSQRTAAAATAPPPSAPAATSPPPQPPATEVPPTPVPVASQPVPAAAAPEVTAVPLVAEQPLKKNGVTSFSSNPPPTEVAEDGTLAEKAPFLSDGAGAFDPEIGFYPNKDGFPAEHTDEKPQDLPPLEENTYWTDSEEEEEEDAEAAKTKNPVARCITNTQQGFKEGYTKLNVLTKGYLIAGLFLISYFVYFGIAMNYEFGSESSHRLFVCTVFAVIIILWSHIMKGLCMMSKRLYGSDTLSPQHRAALDKTKLVLRWIMYACLLGVIVYVLVEEGIERPKNLRSLPGLFCFMLILLVFCRHPSKIDWHCVYWSVGLQFLLALLILKWDTGKESVLWLQSRLDEFFANTAAGSRLLFGENYKDHLMIFGALPTVFFTNAVLTALYYLGAIQWLVRVVGGCLNFILGTSPAENTAATVGIFMEGIASTLALRAYLPYLSKSQLFLVMTSVYASLGGAYLAILSGFGIPLKLLLPAMVISAPATFAVCKLMIPETKWTEEKDQGRQSAIGDSAEEKSKYSNLMDAGQTGATMMLGMVGNIAVVAFSFMSFIDWVNHTLTWFGDRVGIKKLTIEYISSYLLYPIALMMGIEPGDCRGVGMLLGYRLGANNLIAFMKMKMMSINRMIYTKYMMKTNFTGPIIEDGDDIHLVFMNKTLVNGFISERSEAITTYSLCGFSSMLSVAMLMGIFMALLPNRRKWITKMYLPALVAGNIANCMTGCFASIFYGE